MIKFRPHHFLCSLAYQGIGYSPDFVSNYNNIVAQIRNDEETEITVINTLDSICSHCPNQQTKTQTCVTQSKIQKLDNAHAKLLGITNQQKLSWKQAKILIKQHISIEDFHKACEPCEWKKLGICEEALLKLRNN